MTVATMLHNISKHFQCKNDAALARVTGLNRPDISKMLSGKHGEDLRVSTLQRIAIATELPLKDLVEWWSFEQKVFERRYIDREKAPK